MNIQRWVEEEGLGVEPRLIRAAYVVRGRADPTVLEQAFVAVRERHSALRVGFPDRGAAGYSYVREDVVSPLDVVELAGGSIDNAVALVHERVSENGDLDSADVFRARLVRLDAQTAVLGLSVDHLVVDGHSFEQIQRDLWACYAAARRQQPVALAPVGLTYEDYVRWEASWLASEEAERLLVDSDSYLVGVGANPDALLSGVLRDHNDTYDVGTASAAVSREVMEALSALSKSSGKTMFVLMAGSMLTALSAGTGRDQVGTMIPVVRRPTRAMADVVAYSSSYTSIPARFTDELTFDELSSQLRLTVVRALRIGMLPGPAITRRWNPEFLGRLLPRPSAFFDLTSWSWEGGELEVGDLRLEPVDLPEVDGGMIESLEVAATLTEDGATLDAFFPADVYPQTVVEDFLQHWVRVAEAAAADPATPVSELRAR